MSFCFNEEKIKLNIRMNVLVTNKVSSSIPGAMSSNHTVHVHNFIELITQDISGFLGPT